MRKVVAAAAIDNVIIIGTTKDSLFRSTDYGVSWQRVAISQTGQARFFTASSTVVAMVTSMNKMFKSEDKGITWTEVLAPFSTAHWSSALISGQSIYAGFAEGGVMRSTDLGSSWSNAYNGLPRSAVTGIVELGGKLIALTELGGIYASTNNGNSWYESQSGFTSIGGNTECTDGTYVYVSSPDGVFRSLDGEIWRPASTGLPTSTVTALYAQQGLLIAGSRSDGLYTSSNQGSSWYPHSVGLTDLNITGVIGSADHVYITTGSGGLYEFKPDLTSSLVVTGPTYTGYSTVISLLASWRGLYAGTAGQGVLLTTNNGDTWVSRNSGLDTASVRALTESGGYLIAGRSEGWAGPDSGLYRSVDGGLSWRVSNVGLQNPGFSGVPALLTAGGIVYSGVASTDGRGGVYASTDDGASWKQLLPMEFPDALSVSGDTICAADAWDSKPNVALSINKGLTWRSINTGFPTDYPTYVSCLTKYDGTLYAGTGWRGIYSSTNAGASWLLASNGLSNINCFVQFAGRLAAATNKGVYLLDRGEWRPVNEGLTDTVYALAVNATHIFAGTSKGVWRRPLSQLTQGAVGTREGESFDVAVFPNPSQAVLNIRASGLEHEGLVLIYNALGEIVERFEIDPQSATLSWDASKLPHGNYMVVLKSAGRSVVRGVVRY